MKQKISNISINTHKHTFECTGLKSWSSPGSGSVSFTAATQFVAAPISRHLMAVSHRSATPPFRHLREADHAGLKGETDVQV